MQTEEERRNQSRYRASCSPSPAVKYRIRQRCKAPSPYPQPNQNIWLSCTPWRNKTDFLKEIGYCEDIGEQNAIYCDNRGAIALANNPEHHARTKYIDIQYHFVRNWVEDERAHLEYCPTKEMVADGLTNALGPERRWELGKAMGMSMWEEWDGDCESLSTTVGHYQSAEWKWWIMRHLLVISIPFFCVTVDLK